MRNGSRHSSRQSPLRDPSTVMLPTLMSANRNRDGSDIVATKFRRFPPPRRSSEPVHHCRPDLVADIVEMDLVPTVIAGTNFFCYCC